MATLTPFKSIEKGICLIFNYEKFDYGMKALKGSENDVKNLQDTFDLFKFDSVKCHQNLNDTETWNLFNDYAADPKLKSCDCLVVYILSHGKENYFYCKNERTIKIQDVVELFDGNNCAALVGKPKLFFIEACRGKQEDEGVRGSGDKLTLPVSSDILVAYSSYRTYYSYITNNGSRFTKALCQTLTSYSESHDLISMLTIVNNIVVNHKSRRKQQPTIESTLNHKIFFSTKTLFNKKRRYPFINVSSNGSRRRNGGTTLLPDILKIENESEIRNYSITFNHKLANGDPYVTHDFKNEKDLEKWTQMNDKIKELNSKGLLSYSELFKIACEYGLENLIEFSQHHLCDELFDESNSKDEAIVKTIVDLLILAHNNKCTKLKNGAMEYIGKHSLDVQIKEVFNKTKGELSFDLFDFLRTFRQLDSE